MHFSRPTAFIVLSVVASGLSQNDSTESYYATEALIVKANLLANIGPNGSKASGAKVGIVIASPSRNDPDHLYTWTRDSALVFKAVIDPYITGDDSLKGQIENYTAAQKEQQQVSNPSGSIDSEGLGEPKFNIDLSAFTGTWNVPSGMNHLFAPLD